MPMHVTYGVCLVRLAVKPMCVGCLDHQVMSNGLSEWVSKKGLKQYHCAETEKYAHVTFFFNGGTEAQFENEGERIRLALMKYHQFIDPRIRCSQQSICKYSEN